MIGMLLFRFGGQAITFLIIALLARYLGPEQFGIFSTLTIFISFCAIFLAPSLNDLMIREAMNSSILDGNGRRTCAEALRTGYGLRLSLAFVGMLFAVSIGPLMGWDGLNLGLIALSAVSLITSLAMPSFRTSYDIPLQLDYRMDRAAGINFFGRSILLAAFVVSILAGAKLTGIITAQIVGETIAFAILLGLLARSGYPITPNFNLVNIKTLTILAAPLILAEAFTITYTRLDVLLLNYFTGAREAGIFAGPLRLIDGLQIIPTVILGSLIPLFNRLKTENNVDFKRAIKLSARAFWACGIVCAVTMSPFSDSITSLFLGDRYGDSSPILRIGVFCAPLVFAGTLLPAILIVEDEQNLIAILYFFLAIVSVGVNLILIPQFGATGAIYGKLITYAAIYPLALLWKSSRANCWTLLSQGVIPFMLSILATYYLHRLNLSIWWGLPTIFVLSASLIWFTGWFGASKVKELKNLFIGRSPSGLY